MLPFLLLVAVQGPADTAGYWQQAVAYRITASLDEPTGVLTGRERITYVNRSPDVLRDFYVHQYLNAFRPHSRWAAVDSAEGRERFQHQKDPDYAFERITAAMVMGASVAPDYPFAPDSTVAHWTLPRPLAPGDSRYGWEAHPLYPAGEFYGEFATYMVTLDLAADQVIGATGVPLCGDPGWRLERANVLTWVTYQRDFYNPGAVLSDCPAAAAGRKTVRFRAENVHHFAFSLNPEYVYEEGRYGGVVVHVLYLPEDRATWGGGIAVRNTETALAWLDTLYGRFPWPQLTNVHRIEGGGTEFPMMVIDGSAGLGLILHEVGHNYTMGVLANNEWREGFLDEGFTSFQTAWFFEAHGAGSAYPGLEANMLFMDLDRWSEPVSMVSERYRDFPTYNAMIYSKAQLFYEQLRYVVGDDAMRRILRTYYARWQLKHVDEAKFRAVCEEVSRQDLGWLFGQWLHGTVLIDYRLDKVQRSRLPDGRWRTIVTIRRLGDGWMPVEIGDRDTIYARATGQPETERVEFTSARRPGRLRLDPRTRAHDWNALNNGERRGLWGRRDETVLKLDDPTRETVRRDGLTVALRSRQNYLGRFEQNLSIVSAATDGDATHRGGFYFRWANPVAHAPFGPRTETSVAAWSVEGRTGTALHADRSLRRTLVQRSDPHAGFDALWMATTDIGYVDRRLWDDAGTFEAGPWVATTIVKDSAEWRASASLRGGVVYWNPRAGITATNAYDFEGYVRGSAAASVRRPFLLGTRLGVRLYAGGYWGQSPPVRQRRIAVAGADPYATFTNPLLRSRGALLVRPGFYYHAPGGPNLRGFADGIGGRWAVAVNVEGSRSLLERRTGPLREVAVFGFADAGLVDSLAIPSSPAGRAATTLYDGGVGLATRHQVGELEWTLQVELPVIVNRWDFARDARPSLGRAAFRWQVSLEPSF